MDFEWASPFCRRCCHTRGTKKAAASERVEDLNLTLSFFSYSFKVSGVFRSQNRKVHGNKNTSQVGFIISFALNLLIINRGAVLPYAETSARVDTLPPSIFRLE